MKHPHKEIIEAYAADTSVEIEMQCSTGEWFLTDINPVIYNHASTFRLKPKTMRIGEHEFPEPVRVAPATGAVFYVATPNAVETFYWNGVGFDSGCLAASKEANRVALAALESLFNWRADPERGNRCVAAINQLNEVLK
jgi:hypothetical protein